jgi:hypothetical protein
MPPAAASMWFIAAVMEILAGLTRLSSIPEVFAGF